MPSQTTENTLSCNERKIIVDLLGIIARILASNTIDGRKEISDLYFKLGEPHHDRYPH